jgi:hypothetical protein
MSSLPPYKFANSFAGYTFSFALTPNPFQNSDPTKNAKLNSILNVTLPDLPTTCFPFINQFVLQPFGNSYAAFQTNNKAGNTFVPDSSFNAKELSQFFASAFTPGTFRFDSNTNFEGAYDKNTTTVTLQYSYNCNNTVTGGECAQKLPDVVFTFTPGTLQFISKSDSQDIYIPYWTDAQLGDTTTSSGCYPTVDKIKVHLESDPAQQKVLSQIVTYLNFTDNRTKQSEEINKLISINPSLETESTFPPLYFRVVLDSNNDGTLPSNKLRRPFVVSNIQKNGQEVNVLTGIDYGGDTVTSYQVEPISTQVTQNTFTIGLLVFTNLQVTYDNKGRTVATGYNLGLELGSFPTATGALIASNEINTIQNGDVVIIKAKFDWKFDFDTKNDGNYMGFEQKATDLDKVPSMNSTPQNRSFTGTSSNHYYWQVVLLDANGTVKGKAGDPIPLGTPVGFKAYQCSSKDSFVTCGWLSAKSCRSQAGGCYPTMNSTSGNCEVWTIQSVPTPSTGTTVQNGSDVAIQVSNQNICKFPNQWLTNANRTGNNPPTLYSELATDRSVWTLTRVYSSMPLPTD